MTALYEKSAELLGTDYMDFYWIHNPMDAPKWVTELIPLAKSGKIGKIGLSNHSLAEIKEAAEILAKEGLKISAIQNHYSLLNRSSETSGILDYCKENDIIFFSYMVLEQGALTGKYDTEHPFPEDSDRGRTYNPMLPQLEKLNGLIESEATYFSDLYQYYRGWQGESVVYQAESIGYVTYMDEEKLSIVLKESWQMDGQSNLSLYSINVDLLSGEVQNNGGIIEYTRQLAEEFREQSSYQNGRVEAVEMLDDERLLDFLSDENTNIVFYTPVGLEIGFNYTTSDSTGWVTATIKDYGRYVPKF